MPDRDQRQDWRNDDEGRTRRDREEPRSQAGYGGERRSSQDEDRFSAGQGGRERGDYGNASRGYGEGGDTSYGQIAQGASDRPGGGFGGANVGGFGQPGLNSQWGQGGYGPMIEGANYGQGGGQFGPAGAGSQSGRSPYPTHEGGQSDHYGERGQRDSRGHSDRTDPGQRSFGREQNLERGRGSNLGQGGYGSTGSRTEETGPRLGERDRSYYGEDDGRREFGRGEQGREFGRNDVGEARGQDEFGQGRGGFGRQDYSQTSRRSEFQADRHDHDHEPHYRRWRDDQLASHDEDYRRWRDEQAKKYDEDYSTWRNERHSAFSKEFEGWRAGRSGASAGAASFAGGGESGSVGGRAGTSVTTNPSERSVYGDVSATDAGRSTASASPANGAHGANPTLGDIADGGTGADHTAENRSDEREKADTTKT